MPAVRSFEPDCGQLSMMSFFEWFFPSHLPKLRCSVSRDEKTISMRDTIPLQASRTKLWDQLPMLSRYAFRNWPARIFGSTFLRASSNENHAQESIS